MNATRVVMVALLLTAVSVGWIMTLTPPTHWVGTDESFRTGLAMSTITAITHLSGATLFLMSLGAYKAKMRVAYIAIVMGIAGTALGTIQLPVLDILDLMQSWWITSGFVALPFLVSGAAVYIGARHFARLVGAKTFLTRASLVLPAIIIILGLSTLVPHAATASSEMAFDSSVIIIAWTGLMFLTSSLTIFQVSNYIGAHYKRAMLWLGAGLMASTSVIVATVLAMYTTGATVGLDALIDILTVLAGVVYTIAGYTFFKTKEL